MKSTPKYIQKRREKKELKRRSKLSRKRFKVGNSNLFKFYYKYEKRLCHDHKSKLIEYFDSLYSFEPTYKSHFKLPESFSIKENYDETLKIIVDINRSIDYFKGSEIEVILDFTGTKKADTPSLLLLQVSKKEIVDDIKRLNKRLKSVKVGPKLQVIPSKVQEVNKFLIINRFIEKEEVEVNEKGLFPVSTIGFHQGRSSQKSVIENRKGPITTKLIDYINECIQAFSFEITEQGITYLENIVSEILGNAEDHSKFNTWYVTANFLHNFLDDEEADNIGELNIAIFNFGKSIYEGFEGTKVENSEMYGVLEEQFQKHKERTKNKSCSRGDYFTLLALQQGVSRLKFKRIDRGSGTMTFINSFMTIGNFENSKYSPNLHLFSGNTQIICNNDYPPYLHKNKYFLSFNKEQDLSNVQDAKNILSKDTKFPGTMLNAKIYFNEGFLRANSSDDA